MDFNSDTRWMRPIADPASFVMDDAQKAEREAAMRLARRLQSMIRLVCPDDDAATVPLQVRAPLRGRSLAA